MRKFVPYSKWNTRASIAAWQRTVQARHRRNELRAKKRKKGR